MSNNNSIHQPHQNPHDKLSQTSGLTGQYDFKTNEKEILKYWEENGLYESVEINKGEFNRDEYWTLVCPPPNAYDRPHMGNLSGYTYMDMMARYQRMRGKKVIMLPGKDHAGLEGEAVFIRDQLTPQGKKKSDFTRDEFYDLLYKQQQEFIKSIQQDEKLTGLSADFSKDLYTLDPKVVDKVLQTFVDAYKQGLIYKGTRIVNWDPAAQSAVSDSQCEREERDGKLYYIKYELAIKQDKTVLLIHGKHGSPDKDFFRSLESSLLKLGYKVVLPQLPSPDKPDINEHLRILREIIKSQKIDIVLGHSLGCKEALILAEDNSFENIILVAPYPLYRSDAYKQMTRLRYEQEGRNDAYKNYLELSNTNINLEKVKLNNVNIHFLFSDNDTNSELDDINHYKDSFSEDTYKFIALPGKGHFNLCQVEELDEHFFDLTGLTVATTRPETIFADTAVAVHPDDPRYKHLVGRKVRLPGLDREVPIITSKRVEMDFGTGCLKITPAHAQDDYIIMEEWNKENPENKIGYINCIDKFAQLIGPVPEKYLGKKAKVVKDEFANELSEVGLLTKTEDIKQNILKSERTGAVIEQIISSQWFIKVDNLKEELKELIEPSASVSEKAPFSKEPKLRLHPHDAQNRLFAWIDNLKDWAISRSLWWGYRLPVWYKGEKVETIDSDGQVQLKLKVKDDLVDLDFTNRDLVRVQIENPNLENPSFQEGASAEGDGGRLEYKNLQSQGASFLGGSIKKSRKIFNPENFPLDRSSGLPYNPKLTDLASDNRKQMNKPEAGIWTLLKADKYGVDFHRQKIIGNYIVDFFCNELDLVIEIDGNSHDQKSEYDTKRDDYLEKQGLKVIHIWTNDIWHNLENIDIYLDNIIKERQQTFSPASRDSFLKGSIKQNQNINDIDSSSQAWIQDEEVLDTWFSSGQWPYLQLSTWDMMELYPIDCLMSAGDLLIKWDLIMMIMSLIKGLGTPFKNLYLTGLLLGKDGNKMSKSKKNGIPIESVVENYGIDSFRMNCIFKVAPFSNYQITEQTLKSFRNFNNKIWNAAKFVDEYCKINTGEETIELNNAEDIEMKNKLEELKKHYIDMMDNYKFWIISEELYLSFWNEFCDKYIEVVKKRVGEFSKDDTNLLPSASPLSMETKKQYIRFTTQDANEARSNINLIFKEYLKMLHPFVPFVTERIWKEIGEKEILVRSRI